MTHVTSFHWLANLPCLDFVNTEVMSGTERVDLLVGFSGLARWLTEAGLLTEAGAKAALERWDGRSDGAAAVRQAVLFRAGLRRLVERLSEGKIPAADEVEVINRILAERTTHARVVRKAGDFVLTQVAERESALQLLAPIADSAAWLLTEGDAGLLRRCENPQCILFFYDTTRNGKRRWCSMAGCGSRAKAAAYYRRQRAGKRRS
jgi:predicted RNA-binding Zn ribbon-like protein